jgi:hypothetical protein
MNYKLDSNIPLPYTKTISSSSYTNIHNNNNNYNINKSKLNKKNNKSNKELVPSSSKGKTLSKNWNGNNIIFLI